MHDCAIKVNSSVVKHGRDKEVGVNEEMFHFFLSVDENIYKHARNTSKQLGKSWLRYKEKPMRHKQRT